MGESIVSKGKSVKEALDTALDLLGVPRSEVDIEILDSGEKGFLGFKSKPAVVRVAVKSDNKDSATVKDSSVIVVDILDENSEKLKLNSLASDVNPVEDDLGGKVWVLNGTIFCKDAVDKYPLITPVKEVSLYKNDSLVTKTEVIGESDRLRVEVKDEDIEPSWELKISSDKLEANLIVKAGVKIVRKLKDKLPSNYVQLEVEEERTPINIEVGSVMDKLKELGVIHGVDYSAISQACTLGEDGNFIVAKGTLPTKGKHGFFQPIHSVEVKNFIKERLDGSVDFREIREFPAVDFGQVLGVVIPPTEGVTGTTVTGEPIQPEKVYPLTLKAGNGVIVVDGDKVVATESGHPQVKLKGQLALVSVIPRLVIDKDVTLETGNVHYIGDVEVKGSVQDSMQVEARGNVLVRQNTNKSKVISGSSIIVQNNVIASTLTAGSGGLLKSSLAQLLSEVIGQLRNMVTAIRQLSQVSAFKVASLEVTGLGPLIKILCDSKFKGFPALATSLIFKIRVGSSELESEWIDFAERLNRDFITTPISTLRTDDDILSIVKQAESLYLSTKDTNEEELAFLRAEVVQSSELFSSGDILITGDGVYNSKLYAKRNIIIDGFVRGGSIYAEESIIINDVGDRSGSSVLVAVSKTGKIKIKNSSEDITVQVGGQSQRLLTKRSNIFASLDDEGRLVIT